MNTGNTRFLPVATCHQHTACIVTASDAGTTGYEQLACRGQIIHHTPLVLCDANA